MRRRSKVILPFTVLLLVVGFIAGLSGAIPRLVSAANAANQGREIVYYNDMVNEDEIGNNNFNFGPDRKAWAEEAVQNGEAASVKDYIAKSDGAGDFFESIAKDPALCAAIALDIDERLNFDELILVDEQDELIGQRADAAHLHFLSDEEYWNRAVEMITERLTLGEISLQSIGSYTSSMYMYPDHLQGDRPSVIVRNSTNTGGTVLVFDLGKPGIVKYRLECGYQPIDPSYWPTPDEPPVPDNPEPTPDPEPTPTPDPEPTPEPTPDPEPTPAPKDPDAGPQGQNPTNPDFGGGANDPDDTDKTQTPEPTSPDTYEPPAPPSPEPEPDEEEPTVQPEKPSTPTIDDHNDGGTETVGGQDYDVVVGGQNDDTTIDEAYDNHNDGTVEEPVADDGVNTGKIVAPE